MNTETSLPPANPRFAASGLFCFRWWYKGRTVEGNTMKLEGRVVATDASAACDKVEKQMRAEWPTVRWMQGKELEGDGMTFGPTVQKLKTPVEARKQNAKLTDSRRGPAVSGKEHNERT